CRRRGRRCCLRPRCPRFAWRNPSLPPKNVGAETPAGWAWRGPRSSAQRRKRRWELLLGLPVCRILRVFVRRERGSPRDPCLAGGGAVVRLRLRDARLEVQPRLLRRFAPCTEGFLCLVLANLERLAGRVEPVFHAPLGLLVSVDDVVRQIACRVAGQVCRAARAPAQLAASLFAGLRREQQRNACPDREPDEKRRRAAAAAFDHDVRLVIVFVARPVLHFLISSSLHRRPFDFCRTTSLSLTDPKLFTFRAAASGAASSSAGSTSAASSARTSPGVAPSMCAVRSTSPPVIDNVLSVSCRRASANVDPTGSDTAVGASVELRRWRGTTSVSPMVAARDMMTARSTAFFSSRTFPGH